MAPVILSFDPTHPGAENAAGGRFSTKGRPQTVPALSSADCLSGRLYTARAAIPLAISFRLSNYFIVRLENYRVRRPFRTRREVEHYFGGKTIKCLLCGSQFRRLVSHLAAKHGVTVDQYKARFGLPWTRGLTSAPSHHKGWSKKRKRDASRRARKTQFFKFAHPSSRREMVPFVRAEAIEHLGARAAGFGAPFELRVRALFQRGLIDREIADILGVGRMTVNQHTKHWRKRKQKKRRLTNQ